VTASARPRPRSSARAFWLRQLYQWHWISSAVSLIGLILFAVTGVTLNHAGIIKAEPKVTATAAPLPAEIADRLDAVKAPDAPLPLPVRQWLSRTLSVEATDAPAEWSDEEVYLALPRPGGDGWVRFDRLGGQVEVERTTRGVVSLFNDLHKGRNTGKVWQAFIDVFAAACLVFSLTGLFLLQMHARSRPITWPLVAAGLAAPLILFLLFVHL